MVMSARATTAWKTARFALLAAGLFLARCQPAALSAPATAAIAPEAVANLLAPVSASAVAIDPTGEHLAAVNPDSGTISLVDGLTNDTPSVSREVPVGADPRTLSFTPDGSLLLVAAYGSGSVAFVSAATGQVQAQLAVGSRPYGVVAGTRRAYVSLAGRPQIVVLDLATHSVLSRI